VWSCRHATAGICSRARGFEFAAQQKPSGHTSAHEDRAEHHVGRANPAYPTLGLTLRVTLRCALFLLLTGGVGGNGRDRWRPDFRHASIIIGYPRHPAKVSPLAPARSPNPGGGRLTLTL